MRAVRERDRGIQRISSTTRAVAAGSMALSAGLTALIAIANPARAKTVVRSTRPAAAVRTKTARAHHRATTTTTTTTIRPAVTPPSSSPHGGWQTPQTAPAITAPPVTAPPVTYPPVTDPPVIYNPPPPIVSGQS